jgi:hypothetical protein
MMLNAGASFYFSPSVGTPPYSRIAKRIGTAPCTAAQGLGAYPLAAYDLSYDIEQNLLEPRRDASVPMGTKPVDSGAIGG